MLSRQTTGVCVGLIVAVACGVWASLPDGRVWPSVPGPGVAVVRHGKVTWTHSPGGAVSAAVQPATELGEGGQQRPLFLLTTIQGPSERHETLRLPTLTEPGVRPYYLHVTSLGAVIVWDGLGVNVVSADGRQRRFPIPTDFNTGVAMVLESGMTFDGPDGNPTGQRWHGLHRLSADERTLTMLASGPPGQTYVTTIDLERRTVDVRAITAPHSAARAAVPVVAIWLIACLLVARRRRPGIVEVCVACGALFCALSTIALRSEWALP